MGDIAVKGFMLGYLHKTAEDALDPNYVLGRGGVDDQDLGRSLEMSREFTGSDVPSGLKSLDPDYVLGMGGVDDQGLGKSLEKSREFTGSDVPSGLKSNYGPLLRMLKQVGPGMAAGAGAGALGVGGGSVALDAVRGKPINVKRALLLSLLVGAPLGAAGQFLASEGKPGVAALADFGGRAIGQAGEDIAGLGGRAASAGSDLVSKLKASMSGGTPALAGN